MDDYAHGKSTSPELERLSPMLDLQAERSHLPVSGEVLMEVMQTKEGSGTGIDTNPLPSVRLELHSQVLWFRSGDSKNAVRGER